MVIIYGPVLRLVAAGSCRVWNMLALAVIAVVLEGSEFGLSIFEAD